MATSGISTAHAVVRLLALLCVFSLGLSPRLHAKDQSIHALRSAYLYYFSSLIHWPENSTFIDNQLRICAATSDDQDVFQLSTINNKAIGKRHLAIEFIVQSDIQQDLSHCHILFVKQDMQNWLAKRVSTLPHSVLLITEGDHDTQGQIHLFTSGTKLKFNIDNTDLSKKGFQVSSKLLRLSKKEEQ